MSGTLTEFGSLVLLIGDFHTPMRKGDIPACFKELLNTDKIGMVLCTGNVGSKSVVTMLQGIAEECKIVTGDADHGFDFPETTVASVGEFKVGIVHGHQIIPWGDQTALAKCAGRLGVDILVSGHTHRHGVVSVAGKFLVNPGSVTGACNALGEFDITPSFMLMAVQGANVVLYTYEENNGDTKVSVNELKKDGQSVTMTTS
uniref:Vacuolar protein sorting-associated protein 29 n=1 Tax=Pyrodinium bahamense TaxID=73915 RepID=A0A7R9ZVE3_9DINO|mmetsp:Transcript_11349/g.30969  ORF Transcript_11349/g.30969 Transcript_11349/m.30969 type:complete len:202 (+) Transcript_11349:142-747(+)